MTSTLSTPAVQFETTPYRCQHTVRVVTAASLFDGHDAAINIMRRLLQSTGAEVIHLGHNRSVAEIVNAAIQEDAQAIALSSYQGGHLEYFKYVYDLLRERGAGHIKIFGGGGGVIVPSEIEELQHYGIDRIYSPEDGRRMGLQGMINDIMRRCDWPTVNGVPPGEAEYDLTSHLNLARWITRLEKAGERAEPLLAQLRERTSAATTRTSTVVGLTGSGGAGKSSLTDELVLRLLHDFPDLRIALVCVDPTRRKTGGALLGDRIRFNSIESPRVFFRSLATRGAASEISEATRHVVDLYRLAGFDLILVETSGIGQADNAVVELSDVSVYVTTREYGAASQLEKIEMLDYAHLVAINKFDRQGSEDALRDIRKQYRRNHQIDWAITDEQLPIYGTIASQYNDDGVNNFYLGLLERLDLHQPRSLRERSRVRGNGTRVPSRRSAIIPRERQSYLLDVSKTCQSYRGWAQGQIQAARRLQACEEVLSALPAAEHGAGLVALRDAAREALHPACTERLAAWDSLRRLTTEPTASYLVRGREITVPAQTETLSGTLLPRVFVPDTPDWGERLRYLLLENVPGSFPYTAGVFPFKRPEEEPKRMFAGEGTPERTNRRFHYLCEGEKAKRLSTAFDSVTLYGEDPAPRPDIYGKVGNSGVSICTLDDMKKLYAGFDLCDPSTSVSKTINGPAPILLAMFFNTAIDQQVDKFVAEHGRQPSAEEHAKLRDYAVRTVRGTVQADILKEDQAQNTCIYSVAFALRMQGDIQEYFCRSGVQNYYSISISGYHIAEAGANPISQLAFTLANGFTFVEHFLSRGLHIDSFAPNLSFFFSNGLDAEYTVIGRVARRIWSVAMRERYGANERSQMLKYHVQTSGRSLHAQEVAFNDIRTTLQALLALNDNCNSLHTNAYDEAITTPTEESVRRAMAIQMIINREFGLSKSENNLQGSHFVEWFTDEVERRVLEEFENLDRRGGVLAAMETQYQRSKIQEESMYYELKKNSGELPIIGVNTYVNPADQVQLEVKELIRSTEEEKQHQLRNLAAFQQRHAEQAPAALRRLQEVALSGGNVFEELLNTVRVASLGQISEALYQVGGKYRRSA